MNFPTVGRMLALVAGGLVLAACGESPADPLARQFTAPESVNAALLTDGAQSTVFVVDPSVSKTYSFGPHRIYFPAQSICDPLTSGYGESKWDASCSAARVPIAITVTWSLRNEHAFVDFQPALRFVPAAVSDSSRWVVLTLHEPSSLSAGQQYGIAWYRPWDMRWVDESVTDPTLRAWPDVRNSEVTRRIKHFSGYNVTAGFMDASSYDSGFGGLLW
jgi:hypothetical protein